MDLGELLTRWTVRIAMALFRIVNLLRGRRFNRHKFETVGNYIYTVERLEIEKLIPPPLLPPGVKR